MLTVLKDLTAANTAHLIFGEILAHRAAMYTSFCLGDGICKAVSFPVRKRKDMESKPLCAFSTNAGKGREFIYKIFKRSREKGHNVISKNEHYTRMESIAAFLSSLPNT